MKRIAETSTCYDDDYHKMDDELGQMSFWSHCQLRNFSVRTLNTVNAIEVYGFSILVCQANLRKCVSKLKFTGFVNHESDLTDFILQIGHFENLEHLSIQFNAHQIYVTSAFQLEGGLTEPRCSIMKKFLDTHIRQIKIFDIDNSIKLPNEDIGTYITNYVPFKGYVPMIEWIKQWMVRASSEWVLSRVSVCIEALRDFATLREARVEILEARLCILGAHNNKFIEQCILNPSGEWGVLIVECNTSRNTTKWRGKRNSHRVAAEEKKRVSQEILRAYSSVLGYGVPGCPAWRLCLVDCDIEKIGWWTLELDPSKKIVVNKAKIRSFKPMQLTRFLKFGKDCVLRVPYGVMFCDDYVFVRNNRVYKVKVEKFKVEEVEDVGEDVEEVGEDVEEVGEDVEEVGEDVVDEMDEMDEMDDVEEINVF